MNRTAGGKGAGVLLMACALLIYTFGERSTTTALLTLLVIAVCQLVSA